MDLNNINFNNKDEIMKAHKASSKLIDLAKLTNKKLHELYDEGAPAVSFEDLIGIFTYFIIKNNFEEKMSTEDKLKMVAEVTSQTEHMVSEDIIFTPIISKAMDGIMSDALGSIFEGLFNNNADKASNNNDPTSDSDDNPFADIFRRIDEMGGNLPRDFKAKGDNME